MFCKRECGLRYKRKTTDGGANWTDLGAHGLPYTQPNMQFSHAWFTIENVGYINNKYNANIGTTTNGGQTWTPTPLEIQTTNDITFSSANYGYLVAGGAGDLMVTTDICALAEGNGTVAISETNNSTNDLLFYPNPAKGIITIESPVSKGFYTLYDLSGKLMIKGTVSASKFEIDLGSISSGVYIFSVTGEGHEFFKKLIRK